MEQLAIMKDVGYGLRDIGRPCLFFAAYISEGLCSLQVLLGDAADKVIKDAKGYDVKSLEGKPCWVEVDGNITTFIRVAKI